MSLKELSRWITPPPSPFEVGSRSDWAQIQKKLGVKFPTNYRNFIFCYGSGFVVPGLMVGNPMAHTYSSWLYHTCESYREFKDECQHCDWVDVPFEVYPQSPGLLPLASSDNGQEIYYLTHPNSEDWKIVAYDSEHNQYLLFEEKLTSFLYLFAFSTGSIPNLRVTQPPTQPLEFTPCTQPDFFGDFTGDDD